MYKHQGVTEKIIKAFYNVYHVLGYGFLEKVYENAMAIELKKLGIKTKQQHPILVYYDGNVVGEYRADLVVDDKILVELKAAQKLGEDHTAQLLNYLKATPFEIGLLLNFGPEPQIARKIFDNQRKGNATWLKSP